VVFNFLFTTPVISQLVIMIIFAWLIINISLNPKSIVRLDNKILNFLGNISYGIYMYHMLVIFGIVVFFKQYLLIMNSFPSSIIFYLLITTLVIIVSYLSKRFFEDYFLSFKKSFRIAT